MPDLAPTEPRYCFGYNEEQFHGSYASPEEAIEAFGHGEGSTCYTGTLRPVSPETNGPDFEEMAFDAIEECDRLCSEQTAAEDGPVVEATDEQEKALALKFQLAWEEWCREHKIACSWSAVDDVQKHTIPVDTD